MSDVKVYLSLTVGDARTTRGKVLTEEEIVKYKGKGLVLQTVKELTSELIAYLEELSEAGEEKGWRL